MKVAHVRNVMVVPYNENWPDEFAKIKGELAAGLVDSFLAVEHVGSNSVPGLWAKPIIDLDIVIEAGGFEIVKEKLAKLGYTHEGDLGITGRDAFKYEGKTHLMAHHLYVCASNSAELHRHLAFRDFLRTHPADRDRYAAVKRELAEKIQHDIDGYIAGKDPVIQEIYRKIGL